MSPASSSDVKQGQDLPKLAQPTVATMKDSKQLGLKWSEAERKAYLGSIKTVYLKRLATSYPEGKLFHAPTQAVKEQWEEHWDGKELADKRRNKNKRPGVIVLDESRLQYTIEANESVLIYEEGPKNKEPKLVMVVLRDFVSDPELCISWTKICKDLVGAHRDDRVSFSAVRNI